MAVSSLRQTSRSPSRLAFPTRRENEKNGSTCRPRSGQRWLFCVLCGEDTLYARGYCRKCYNASDHSRRHFSGFRLEVLERDGWRCRVCGAGTNVVHHRRPGHDHPRYLISLCPAHHAIVTRLLVLDRHLPPLLLLLWREQHPDAAEQLLFTWSSRQEQNGWDLKQGLWRPDAALLEAFSISRLAPEAEALPMHAHEWISPDRNQRCGSLQK